MDQADIIFAKIGDLGIFVRLPYVHWMEG